MSQSTTSGDRLTPAERRAIAERTYWETSLHTVDSSGASVIAGLELPVVGDMVEEALDHAISTTIAMLQHPDDDLRWTADVALVLRGKFLAIVRRTPHGVDVVGFDAVPPLPAERVLPGRRASRASSILFIDGSLESTGYGLGMPLRGREVAVALDEAIRSTREAMQAPHAARDDVAISLRGRFLAILRSTPDGPVLTRFDQVTPESGELADRPDRGVPQPPPTVAGGRDRKSRSASGPSMTLSS